MDDAGIADQNIHRTDLGKGFPYGAAICHIAADWGSAGFFCDGAGSFVIFFVEEENLVAPGGKGFHGGSTDSTGTTGDDNLLHGFMPLS